SNAVEMGQLSEMITSFAIAYQEIQFAVVSNQKNILNLLPVSDVKERLRIFFGDELVSQLLLVEDESVLGGRAYISNPLVTKPTGRWQFFFLNRRFIRDRIIAAAVRKAYYEIIPGGRYPAVFLFMHLPFEEYDVNVHPTKLEVRFRNGWQIHDNILGLIRKKLLDSELPASVVSVTPGWTGEIPLSGSPVVQQSSSVMQALVDFFKTHPGEHFQSPPSAGQANLPNQTSAGPIFPRPAGPDISRAGSAPANSFPSDSATSLPAASTGVFQVHNTYIITEDRDGLLIFDQHALHERILWTQFKEQMRMAVLYRQKLLMPVLVELEMSESALLGEVKPYLEKVGLEIEEFGGRTISIQAIPQILNNVNLPELIHELLDNFMTDKPASSAGKEEDVERTMSDFVTKNESDKVLDDLVKVMACKAAVKAGDRLAPEEIQALLKAQNEPGYTTTCPHGRPAVWKITLAELNKYFQRPS
ncbi:MAG: DNA mismatch repair endonuclease MutL, partial [Planctomycetota bacterium]